MFTVRSNRLPAGDVSEIPSKPAHKCWTENEVLMGLESYGEVGRHYLFFALMEPPKSSQ